MTPVLAFTEPPYFEWLEQNTHIVYPLLGVGTLVLLAVGIIQAWRSQDLDGLQKAEFKRQIILELRRDSFGVTAELLAKRIDLESLKIARLLEELQIEGLVSSSTNTHRITTWRMKTREQR
jgi:hypothetical protein